MNKYEPLQEHLKNRGMEEVPMDFSEIERVLNSKLPPSARKYRAWWSNNPSNSVMTYSWLNAGYRTSQVNLEGERVVFIKTDSDHKPQSKPVPPNAGQLFGCMKGTVTVSIGIDLTEPSGEVWDEDQQ